jgi:DNA polymerase II small subunit
MEIGKEQAIKETQLANNSISKQSSLNSIYADSSYSSTNSISLLSQNEFLKFFAKKGFLLDKEPLEFLFSLNSVSLIEEILNKIFLLTKTRIITKNLLLDTFKDTKNLFQLVSSQSQEKQEKIKFFFKQQTASIEVIKAVKEPRIEANFKIISSEIIPHKRIEVKDFVTHFKNRYNLFKDILQARSELSGLVSINKIGNNRTFSIIALVRAKRVTKNKNIILEAEDLTGKINVLVNSDKEETFKKAKEIVCDDVVGLKCSGNGDFVYANDIFFPESVLQERKKADAEGYAVFISDIHVGSKLFLEEKFKYFINWLNGINTDEITKEKVSKIKYLFICGDNIDGVGVYPNQESLLAINNCHDQYKKLAEFLKQIPSHIKIIMCPGQHDAVRVPEPQPAIGEDFAAELTQMPNVFLVSNPATVEIECSKEKKGIRVLMYHGASMIRTWMDEIEELRLSKAYLNPSKITKYMLRHRHLSPTHSSNVYVPSEKEDPLAIKEVPDIILTGDLHKADIDIYNNILIIAGSCWQTTTPFEEKVGNHPDPCKVPLLNLKTREIKILDFS